MFYFQHSNSNSTNNTNSLSLSTNNNHSSNNTASTTTIFPILRGNQGYESSTNTMSDSDSNLEDDENEHNNHLSTTDNEDTQYYEYYDSSHTPIAEPIEHYNNLNTNSNNNESSNNAYNTLSMTQNMSIFIDGLYSNSRPLLQNTDSQENYDFEETLFNAAVTRGRDSEDSDRKKHLVDFFKMNNELASSWTMSNQFDETFKLKNMVQSLSFLKPGCEFYGTQDQIYINKRRSQSSGLNQKEQWEVIKHIDYKTATIVGIMDAYNVPSSTKMVQTYWEGEIIDFVNYGLYTNKWKADFKADIDHWKMFEAFEKFDAEKEIDYNKLAQEIFSKYIFMRWKEKHFVNVSANESGLTISGFYYISIRRDNGHIEGYYYDPNTKPYQRLYLKPHVNGNGMCFGDYQYI